MLDQYSANARHSAVRLSTRKEPEVVIRKVVSGNRLAVEAVLHAYDESPKALRVFIDDEVTTCKSE